MSDTDEPLTYVDSPTDQPAKDERTGSSSGTEGAIFSDSGVPSFGNAENRSSSRGVTDLDDTVNHLAETNDSIATRSRTLVSGFLVFVVFFIAAVLSPGATGFPSDIGFGGVVMLSLFLLTLTYRLDSEIKFGRALFEEVSDELQWAPPSRDKSSAANDERSPSSERPHISTRFEMRRFSQLENGPLSLGVGRLGLLVVLINILSIALLVAVAIRPDLLHPDLLLKEPRGEEDRQKRAEQFGTRVIELHLRYAQEAMFYCKDYREDAEAVVARVHYGGSIRPDVQFIYVGGLPRNVNLRVQPLGECISEWAHNLQPSLSPGIYQLVLNFSLLRQEEPSPDDR